MGARRKAAAKVLSFVLAFALTATATAAPQQQQPPGAAIAALARAAEGRTFGKGECWDFAAALLDRTACKWERPFAFGRPLDAAKEAPQPGDIIQFQSVVVEWKKGNRFGTIRLGFPDHTAIVLASHGSVVELAHQNYNGIRKVTLLSLDLKGVKSGKWTAYRPVKK